MPSVQLQSFESTMFNTNGKPILVERNPRCKATQTTPRWDRLKDPKEPLALDIEFQECKKEGAEKWHHRIGRIAFVNSRGETIYDTYVRYDDEEGLAMKMGPRRFGVTWRDIKLENGAKTIHEVEENLRKIMQGRIIVGHGMRLDIAAIDKKLWDVVGKIVDTQHLYGQVALGRLVDTYLDLADFAWHDPTADAKATMLLYLRLQPYNAHPNFEEVKFVYSEDDFPALGAGPSKKRS